MTLRRSVTTTDALGGKRPGGIFQFPPKDHPMTVLLTPREHRYLWFLSQGYTPRQIWPLMNCGSSPSTATRIKDKLRARTMEHAVFLACQQDLIGDHCECGTLEGYRAHQGRGDLDPCRACRRAFAEYAERHNGPTLKKVTLTEAELRLLRAYDSGRSFAQVLERWGCARRTLDEVRRNLYRKLDVAHLPQQSKYQAAIDTGRRLGYLRPVSPIPLPEKIPVRREQKLTDLEVRTLRVLAEGASLREAGIVLGGKTSAAISARLAGIYQKLDVLHHGHGERREAAVDEARRQGYDV